LNVAYANGRAVPQLTGLTALVTGAGSGIGRATAIALADQGMRVILVGRRESLLHEAEQEISHGNGHAIARSCDLADADSVTRLVQTVMEDLAGRLAILVHSAAMYSIGAVEDTSVGQFDLVFRTNVRAPLQLTQLLLPAIRRAHGDIVFVNSSAALHSPPNVSLYAASKAALTALADSLRQEVNSAGIRVLSVYPGRVATPMQEAISLADNREYVPDQLLQPTDVAQLIVNALLLGTTAELTDLHVRPLYKPKGSERRKSLDWD
jgi:NAD(P)-dependent dehydrogenase (short-subunit alcohol dehydrogenase family)